MLWSVWTRLSPNFQFLLSSFQILRDCSKHVNYNWFHPHLHVPQLIIIITVYEFFPPVIIGGFYRSSSNNKCPWLSVTLSSILADLRSDMPLMLSILFQISLSLFSRYFDIVPSALTMIGITVTFMFHNFFSSLAKFW